MTDFARIVYIVGCVVAFILAILVPSYLATMNVCGWAVAVIMTLAYDTRTEEVLYLAHCLKEKEKEDE